MAELIAAGLLLTFIVGVTVAVRKNMKASRELRAPRDWRAPEEASRHLDDIRKAGGA